MEKIKYLKGLADGTRSINEIIPMQSEYWRNHGDGFYYRLENGERLSHDEFEKREELDPHTFRIVCRSNGLGPPIATCEEEVII